MFPLLHVVMFTLCLVSIADVSTATCFYVYIVFSKLSRCFHYYMLLCLHWSSKHSRCFHCYMFYVYIGLVSIADVSTTTCCYVYIGLVSIADVSTASCCYVYIVSSKHSRCFHCYIL